jgi:phage gp29-like protein
MDRALVMLWRGGDLSTISRENGTGSNPQQEDSDELDGDNAEWVGETINRNLTERVLRWHFGPETPILCQLKLRTKSRDNVTQDMEIVNSAKALGVRISKAWFVNKFQVVEADKDEPALGESSAPAIATAINAREPIGERLLKIIQNPHPHRGLDDIFSALEKAAQDPGIDDAEFLKLAEEAVEALKPLSPVAAEELAAELNDAMAAKAAAALKQP